MKKIKNENVKDIVVEEIETTAKNQTARGKEKEKNETLFKKVLYGYDPEEVASYIEDINNTYESAARMQEAKLSSIKEELVLANRERDFYSEKLVLISLSRAVQRLIPVTTLPSMRKQLPPSEKNLILPKKKTKTSEKRQNQKKRQRRLNIPTQ